MVRDSPLAKGAVVESLLVLPDHQEPAKPVRRHGQPWLIADYELLVQGLRDGLEVPALAARLGRSASVMLPRLRRLLPVAQRECPPEFIMDALRAALADADYDWRGEMLLSPPIVRNEIVHTGVEGLTDDEAVTVVYALLASAGHEEAELLERLVPRMERDGLLERVIDLRAQRAVRASPFSIDEHAAWAQASYWVRGRCGYRGWYRRHTEDW